MGKLGLIFAFSVETPVQTVLFRHGPFLTDVCVVVVVCRRLCRQPRVAVAVVASDLSRKGVGGLGFSDRTKCSFFS